MSALELTPRGDTYFQIRISRNTFVAFLASIIVHALLLFTSIPLLLLNGSPQGNPEPVAITVRLNPVMPKAEEVAPPAKAPEPVSLPKQARKSKPKIITSPHASASKVVAEDQPALQVPVERATATVPIPAPVAAPDLMSYMQAVRERRRLAELGASREYAQAAAPEHIPSADEIRMANIKRNLQMQGTNGLFQIMSMGVRSAQFSFRGWTTDFNNSRREVIEVEVEPGADLERAVVRRMIELIRRHYSGDFNWESVRLGRVVVMSARVEDGPGLEDFMMQEFFGTGFRYPPP